MEIYFEKIKSIIKKNWVWIVCLVALIGFLAIAEDVFENEIMRVDTIAYNLIVENLRNNVLTRNNANSYKLWWSQNDCFNSYSLFYFHKKR